MCTMYSRAMTSRNAVCGTAFVVLLLIFSQRSGAAGPNRADGLTASDIISRMREAYATSTSYSDSGLVKEVYIRTSGTRTIEKPFTTAFIRPDRFRFEFTEKMRGDGGRRFVIYRNGEDLRVYWDVDKNLEPESIDRAVAAATGVSGESAVTVPAMLLPKEIKWRRAIRFNKPDRIEDDTLGDVDCFRIHDYIGGNPVTWWIDKAEFLLRKVHHEMDFDDFRALRTTTYKPVLNGDVTGPMLEFKAPGGRP